MVRYCPVCRWEDDRADNDAADRTGGPNHLSLTQARQLSSTRNLRPRAHDLRGTQHPPALRTRPQVCVVRRRAACLRGGRLADPRLPERTPESSWGHLCARPNRQHAGLSMTVDEFWPWCRFNLRVRQEHRSGLRANAAREIESGQTTILSDVFNHPDQTFERRVFRYRHLTDMVLTNRRSSPGNAATKPACQQTCAFAPASRRNPSVGQPRLGPILLWGFAALGMAARELRTMEVVLRCKRASELDHLLPRQRRRLPRAGHRAFRVPLARSGRLRPSPSRRPFR
ncbi:MAG: hypothetical protein H6717_24270 [Polyangiaceae bacterium]|nr:hypothetical protein [Polyangiaceae bacterium]